MNHSNYYLYGFSYVLMKFLENHLCLSLKNREYLFGFDKFLSLHSVGDTILMYDFH